MCLRFAEAQALWEGNSTTSYISLSTLQNVWVMCILVRSWRSQAGGLW
jgi:hypothetical protein